MNDIIHFEVKEERDVLFKNLYLKAFPAVARYISRRGGTYEEAKDIFQDSLVIYYEKIASDNLTIDVNEKSYILGIAKHLWYKRHKEDLRNIALETTATGKESEQEDATLSSNKLLRLMETAGQRCMEILKAFYYDKLPVADIAGKFGYSGTRSATVQKYKCLEKVRDTIKEKSLSYEDFLE